MGFIVVTLVKQDSFSPSPLLPTEIQYWKTVTYLFIF